MSVKVLRSFVMHFEAGFCAVDLKFGEVYALQLELDLLEVRILPFFNKLTVLKNHVCIVSGTF